MAKHSMKDIHAAVRNWNKNKGLKKRYRTRAVYMSHRVGEVLSESQLKNRLTYDARTRTERTLTAIAKARARKKLAKKEEAAAAT